MSLMLQYWPWWVGAFALTVVAVGYFYSLGIPCGVSGVFGRVIDWREEVKARETELAMTQNASRMQEQMMAEALAALQDLPEEERKLVEAEMRAAQPEEPAGAAAGSVVRPHPVAQLAFLLAIAGGGLLAALSSGQWHVVTNMGETYTSFFGSGPMAWAVLFVGGLCVGIGTQMAGGCTLGHGITGNSSLQLGSLTATAAFFGTAVVASFLFMVLL